MPFRESLGPPLRGELLLGPNELLKAGPVRRVNGAAVVQLRLLERHAACPPLPQSPRGLSSCLRHPSHSLLLKVPGKCDLSTFLHSSDISLVPVVYRRYGRKTHICLVLYEGL